MLSIAEAHDVSSKVQPPKALQGKLRIHFPDMFSSIMAADPVVNVHYEAVKQESAEAFKELFHMDEYAAIQYAKADFGYLCAIWVPYADKEALRTLTDWQYWAFMFDDQFDEGHLKDDPIRAQAAIDEALSIVVDDHPPIDKDDKPLLWLFQTIWQRFQKRSLPDRQKRFREYHAVWFEGLMEQVHSIKDETWANTQIDEYMDRRRITLGGLPSFAMVEYCCDIRLPQSYIEHPSIQECMRISLDLMILSNDILSLPKDLAENGDINLIRLLKGQHISEQAAVDEIGRRIDKCYSDWYLGLSKLPPYGEKLDKELLRWVDCCRNMALGNAHWSFKSQRYFGTRGAEVKELRYFDLEHPV